VGGRGVILEEVRLARSRGVVKVLAARTKMAHTPMGVCRTTKKYRRNWHIRGTSTEICSQPNTRVSKLSGPAPDTVKV